MISRWSFCLAIGAILSLSGCSQDPQAVSRQTDEKIYIIEFKIGTAAEALAQIQTKDYAKPWLSDTREKVLLGIGFSPEKRNIDDWVVGYAPNRSDFNCLD